MSTKKTYFQGLDELANNPELEQFQQREFAEKLPTEAFLGLLICLAKENRKKGKLNVQIKTK